MKLKSIWVSWPIEKINGSKHEFGAHKSFKRMLLMGFKPITCLSISDYTFPSIMTRVAILRCVNFHMKMTILTLHLRITWINQYKQMWWCIIITRVRHLYVNYCKQMTLTSFFINFPLFRRFVNLFPIKKKKKTSLLQ